MPLAFLYGSIWPKRHQAFLLRFFAGPGPEL